MNKLDGITLKSFSFALSDPAFYKEALIPLLLDATPKNFGKSNQVMLRLHQMKTAKDPAYQFWFAVVEAINEEPANRINKFFDLLKNAGP